MPTVFQTGTKGVAVIEKKKGKDGVKKKAERKLQYDSVC